MALGMLTPLNANAQAATILPSGGPGALEVAMARNDKEDKLGADVAAARAAAAGEAAKAKEAGKAEAAKRMAELGKETVFRHYGPEWKGMYNGYVDEYAKASQLHAQDPEKYSDPDDPGTEAGSYFFKRQMDLHQAKKSSDDIQTQYEADMAYFKANQSKFRPGALQEMEAKYADPTAWKNGEVIDKPLELWDLEGNVKATFGAMKNEVLANAGPTGDGGAFSWSLERPVPGALKGLAQTFAADAWADGSLQERFASLSVPAMERIKALAEKNGMSPGEALALDMATNLYGATTREETYNAPTATGYGMKKEEAQAMDMFEIWKGVANGTHAKYKDVRTALPDVTGTQFGKLLEKNPQLEGFFDKRVATSGEVSFDLKPGISILKDLGKYTIGKEDEVTDPSTGKKYANPIKPLLVFQNDENKAITVVSGSSSNIKNGTVKISDPMSRSETFSKFFIPAATNTDGMDPGAFELYAESQGVQIRGRQGDVNPENQDVRQLDRGANPATPTFNAPKPGAQPLKFNAPKK